MREIVFGVACFLVGGGLGFIAAQFKEAKAVAAPIDSAVMSEVSAAEAAAKDLAPKSK